MSHLAYADDLVLLAKSADELQRLLDCLTLELSKMDLEINLEKSYVWIREGFEEEKIDI